MYTLILQKAISDIEIKNMVKDIFKVEDVFNTNDELFPINCSISYDFFIYNDAYKQQINIYLDKNFGLEESQVAKYFASKFNTNVIISDEELNPYSWLLICPNEKILKVIQKGNTLDFSPL